MQAACSRTVHVHVHAHSRSVLASGWWWAAPRNFGKTGKSIFRLYARGLGVLYTAGTQRACWLWSCRRCVVQANECTDAWEVAAAHSVAYMPLEVVFRHLRRVASLRSQRQAEPSSASRGAKRRAACGVRARHSARSTGVSAATVRVWSSSHTWPVPASLPRTAVEGPRTHC